MSGVVSLANDLVADILRQGPGADQKLLNRVINPFDVHRRITMFFAEPRRLDLLAAVDRRVHHVSNLLPVSLHLNSVS